MTESLAKEHKGQGYILVEAVNILEHVFDTSQLSAVRGSSLILQDAINTVKLAFAEELSAVSVGASSGLFCVSSNISDISALVSRVVDLLNDEGPPKNHEGRSEFRYFTFVVESCRAKSVGEARDRLLAKARFRQLRQISKAPDSIVANAARAVPCAGTGTRVAIRGQFTDRKADLPEELSESFARRRAYGRKARANPSTTEASRTDSTTSGGPSQPSQFGFTRDIETLADCTRFRTLNNKIAVIYLDGNAFGALHGKAHDRPKAQRELDEEIRAARKLVRDDLTNALATGTYESVELLEPSIEQQNGEPHLLRFETLLWGGDEMTFIAPAWLGFDVLQLIYALWRKHTVESPRLNGTTHAAGIVFCHAKTPIARIREQARQLAEWTKEQEGGRERDLYSHMVLESIDYPIEPNLDAFFAARYGPVAERRGALAPDPRWTIGGQQATRDALSGDLLSRGSVCRLARTLVNEDVSTLFGGLSSQVSSPPPWQENYESAESTSFELLERRAFEAITRAAQHSSRERIGTALNSLCQTFGLDPECPAMRARLWLHLEELWVYLAPNADRQGSTG